VWHQALVVSLLAAWSVPTLVAADDAAKIYEEGRKAERAGHMAQAYLLYSQASALDPPNQLYRLKSVAVQSRAALESPPKPRDPAQETGAASADPTTVFDRLSQKDRAAEENLQPPVQLKAAPGHLDFDLRADAKSLWEQVAHAFHLETVFDGDYQAGPPIRFRLTDVDYRNALHGLEAATGSFVVPISSRLFLVVKDTEPKRRDIEPTMAVTLSIPQATTAQDLTEIAQAVRQLFGLEHVAWDSQQNMVVLRGRVSLVVPARQIFEQLLHHRPQVSIEMDLLEVDRSYSLAYGVEGVATLPVAYLGTFWNNPLSVPSAVAGLLTFGGGQSTFGIAVASATMIANMSLSGTRNLIRSEVRSLDGLPASVHIGSKFPVLTAGYFGPASFSTGGTVVTPPPSFTFEDLGLNMKVTPRIHGMDEVTLDLDTEFKVLAGSSVNGIPVISSRKFTSKVRLREGEWAVVAGLMSTSEARDISGIAGLSNLPVLGKLFSETTKDETTTEVLLVIKPSLLNLPPDQFATPTIWTGSELRPTTPL
jgi:general secretion pathway protein D